MSKPNLRYLVPLFAFALLFWGSPLSARGGCEVCPGIGSQCDEDALDTVCIDWSDPELGTSCQSWTEPICEQMALSVQDVDASGLLRSDLSSDLVALGGEDIRRACDGAILAYFFDSTEEETIRATAAKLTI